MTYRVAINGFGRIGRDYLRCLFDRGLFDEGVVVVGINDLWDDATLTHLFQYDSTFGPLDRDIRTAGGALLVDGWRIPLFKERDPAVLPWGELGVDLVVESTGKFRSRDDAAQHLKAGARKGCFRRRARVWTPPSCWGSTPASTGPGTRSFRPPRARPTVRRRWLMCCTARSGWSRGS